MAINPLDASAARNTMIKQSFLRKQVEKAAKTGTTPTVLRSLVLSLVDDVAKAHYGTQYPMKCLQTAAAIQQVLAAVGIQSTLWCGAACFAEVFEDPPDITWGGFWDQDHHVWVATQFHEYVDLSISQLHRHPRSRRGDGVPIPAVWWDDITQWPRVIRYLPDSPAGIRLEGEDAADLSHFLQRVDRAFNDLLMQGRVDAIRFAPVLAGPDSMNELYARGLPWAVRSYFMQAHNAPFPAWIAEREAELTSAWESGESAPSRLIGTIG